MILITTVALSTDWSHAENFVHAAFALHRAGLVFTENDIDQIAATFQKKV
jgi:ribosome-binding factor A